MQVLREILAYRKKPEWKEGMRIYHSYTHRRLKRVKRRLALVQEPTGSDWNILNHEIDLIESILREGLAKYPNEELLQLQEAIKPPPKPKKASKRAKPQGKEVLAQKKNEVEAKALPNEIFEEFAPKESEFTELDALYKRRQQLALKRAVLSNKLRDPEGKQVSIQENIKTLEEMQPFVQEIKEIENKIEQYEKTEHQESIPDDERILISRRNESYSLKQLNELTMEDLKGLKKRLNDDLIKARKVLAGQGSAKKESTLKRNEKVEAQRVREISALKKIMNFRDQNG